MDGADAFGILVADIISCICVDRNGKPNLIGILFTFLLLFGIGYGIYYYSKDEPVQKNKDKECGTVILKLRNEEVVVLLNGEKVVKKISKELYINTEEKEEICFPISKQKENH